MCNPFEVPELVREQIMTFCKSNRPELIVPVFRFTHAVITAEDAEFRKLLDVSSDHAEFIEATGQFMALVPLSISLEVPQPLSRRIDPATILSGQVTSEDTKVIGEFRLENDEVKMLTFGRSVWAGALEASLSYFKHSYQTQSAKQRIATISMPGLSMNSPVLAVPLFMAALYQSGTQYVGNCVNMFNLARIARQTQTAMKNAS